MGKKKPPKKVTPTKGQVEKKKGSSFSTEAQDKFERLGNLAFYPTNYDSKDQYLFYYDALLKNKTAREQRYPEYGIEREKIKAEGEKKYGTSRIDDIRKRKDDDGKDKITKALEILEQAIEYETNNEQKFLSRKIKEIETLAKDEPQRIPELEQLKKIFSSAITTGDNGVKEIDYDQLIMLTNALYQGLDNTKNIVKYETNRLQELESIKAAQEKSLRGTAAGLEKKLTNENKNADDVEKIMLANNKRKIALHYTAHGSMHGIRGFKGRLKKFEPTADVKIAQWITQVVIRTSKTRKFRKEIMNIINQSYNPVKGPATINSNEIVSTLIASASQYATRHMGEILNGTLTPKNFKFSDMIEEGTIQMGDFDISGLYDNFGQFGHKLKLFNQAFNKNGRASAESVYDAIDDFIKEERKVKVSKLNKDQSILHEAMLYYKNNGGVDYVGMVELIHRLENLAKQIQNQSEELLLAYEEQEKRLAEGIKEYQAYWLKTDTGESTLSNIPLTLHKDANGNIDIDLAEINNAIRKALPFQSLGDKRLRATDLLNEIAGLKTRVSNSFAANMQKMANDYVQNVKAKVSSSPKVLNAFQKALENMKISVGGPAFSEIVQGIQARSVNNNIVLSWTGKSNTKNDFVTIQPEISDINSDEFISYIEDILDDNSSALAKDFAEAQKELRTQFLDGIQEAIVKTQNTKGQGYNQQAINAEKILERQNELKEGVMTYSEKMKKHTAAMDSLIKKLSAAGYSQEKIADIKKKMVQSLQDDIYVSSTMKTYNEYNNDFGFVGGSIGVDIYAQLDNLNQVFTKAGIPIDESDLNWLKGAIINCSPESIVGEKHKIDIEYYLGSLASFMLFDEGGAEVSILDNLMTNQKRMEESTTPKIMHLYHVNGLYYPGSFVLRNTLNMLKKYQQDISTIMDDKDKNSGASVFIRNTISYVDMPNKKELEVLTPWETVAGKAKKNDNYVSIKILFLASLLDTLNRINQKMAVMELP